MRPIRGALAACLVAVLLSAAVGQASAGDGQPAREFWVWVDRHGSLSMTDDERRIPRAYRGEAVPRAADWPRVTVDKVGKEARREALRVRLDALRAALPASCGCAALDH